MSTYCVYDGKRVEFPMKPSITGSLFVRKGYVQNYSCDYTSTANTQYYERLGSLSRAEPRKTQAATKGKRCCKSISAQNSHNTETSFYCCDNQQHESIIMHMPNHIKRRKISTVKSFKNNSSAKNVHRRW